MRCAYRRVINIGSEAVLKREYVLVIIQNVPNNVWARYWREFEEWCKKFRNLGHYIHRTCMELSVKTWTLQKCVELVGGTERMNLTTYFLWVHLWLCTHMYVVIVHTHTHTHTQPQTTETVRARLHLHRRNSVTTREQSCVPPPLYRFSRIETSRHHLEPEWNPSANASFVVDDSLVI